MKSVAYENFHATTFSAVFVMAGMWVLQSLEKKFQSPGYPTTLGIATRLTESMLFLRNLRPNPGFNGEAPPGFPADDNLISP